MITALAIATLVLTGCRSATTACEPKGTSVNICVGGEPIDFSKEPFQPHVHEPGNIYAPVLPVAAASESFTGIHVHEGALFVPLMEFAEATGLLVSINADQGTTGFARAAISQQND